MKRQKDFRAKITNAGFFAQNLFAEDFRLIPGKDHEFAGPDRKCQQR
jgi:hypothetical protein